LVDNSGIFKKCIDPLEQILQNGSQSSEVRVRSAPGACRDYVSFLRDSLAGRMLANIGVSDCDLRVEGFSPCHFVTWLPQTDVSVYCFKL